MDDDNIARYRQALRCGAQTVRRLTASRDAIRPWTFIEFPVRQVLCQPSNSLLLSFHFAETRFFDSLCHFALVARRFLICRCLSTRKQRALSKRLQVSRTPPELETRRCCLPLIRRLRLAMRSLFAKRTTFFVLHSFRYYFLLWSAISLLARRKESPKGKRMAREVLKSRKS